MNKRAIKVWKSHEKFIRKKAQAIIEHATNEYYSMDFPRVMDSVYLLIHAQCLQDKADKIKNRISFCKKN